MLVFWRRSSVSLCVTVSLGSGVPLQQNFLFLLFQHKLSLHCKISSLNLSSPGVLTLSLLHFHRIIPSYTLFPRNARLRRLRAWRPCASGSAEERTQDYQWWWWMKIFKGPSGLYQKRWAFIYLDVINSGGAPLLSSYKFLRLRDYQWWWIMKSVKGPGGPYQKQLAVMYQDVINSRGGTLAI